MNILSFVILRIPTCLKNKKNDKEITGAMNIYDYLEIIIHKMKCNDHNDDDTDNVNDDKNNKNDIDHTDNEDDDHKNDDDNNNQHDNNDNERRRGGGEVGQG